MGTFAKSGAWSGVIGQLIAGTDLSAELTSAALGEVLAGDASDAQIAAFVVGLRSKGETPEEVVGLVDAMLGASSPLDLKNPRSTLDIVGTGGSKALAGKAFNVSTMASIVAAAAGAVVCKHGNRKASSTSGSTDLLEALGVEVELDGPGVARCVDEVGVGFAFARVFHPSMRHVAGVRSELGIPTVFNVLGPLSHPARVGRQVVGVANPALVELVAGVLLRNGLSRAWVVNGAGVLDELTTTGVSTVTELRDGELRSFEVEPDDVGLAQATLSDLGVGGPEENARVARSVLAGEPGALRDMVVLNAAAGLVVADLAEDLAAGVAASQSAIDDGSASEILARLVSVSREAAALKGAKDGE